MGDKSSISMEKIEWPRQNVATFVAIIYEKVKQGKLQTSTFKPDVWNDINQEMRIAVGKDYGVNKLKGKYNRLRLRHRLFSALLAHTGVTWDPDMNQVNAPEEVWGEFYKKNMKEYKSLRKEGCEHYPILGEIFGGVHVNTEKVDENEGDSSLSKRKNDQSSNSRRQKVSNSSRLEKLEAAIDKWSATVTTSSTIKNDESIARKEYFLAKVEKYRSCQTTQENDAYSMEVCLDIINNMDHLDDDTYSKATLAFENPMKRMTFVKMEQSRRTPWLERL
ncbi:uncharacterized protein LOC119991522 [Tripterygium wilfordii]|uniref:uncharacterized protein LOC119991522 n=1 Tax=Tripterygium wilfordii TaxID=458696 RepID=UPI0018F8546B|nr:uncharacterized protein LOC119991522 [Tripterygium wilfordii]